MWAVAADARLQLAELQRLAAIEKNFWWERGLDKSGPVSDWTRVFEREAHSQKGVSNLGFQQGGETCLLEVVIRRECLSNLQGLHHDEGCAVRY